MVINQYNLDCLPEDGSIHNNLAVQEEEFTNAEATDAEATNAEVTNAETTNAKTSNVDLNPESNDISDAVNHVFIISDLRLQQTKLEFIQKNLISEISVPPQPNVLFMASFRQTPVSE